MPPAVKRTCKAISHDRLGIGKAVSNFVAQARYRVGDARMMLDQLDGYPAKLGADARARLVTEIDALIRDARALRRTLTGEERTCEVCGAKFLGRADARFHSATCRQRAHRAGNA